MAAPCTRHGPGWQRIAAVTGNRLALEKTDHRTRIHTHSTGRKRTEIALVLLALAVLFIVKTVKVVPQQHAWVIERLGN